MIMRTYILSLILVSVIFAFCDGQSNEKFSVELGYNAIPLKTETMGRGKDWGDYLKWFIDARFV